MEFMDRRDRSQLVQFWLTVESFKDPLESLDSSGDDDIGTLQAEPDQSRMRDDVSMLLDLYFPSRGAPQLLSIISSGDVQTMRNFAANIPQTVSSTRFVRRAVLMSQSQVEKGMDQDFIDFRNSDLWYRAIKDLPQVTQSIPQPGHISSFDVKSVPKSLSGGTGDALVANIRSSPASSIQQDLKGSIGSLSNLDLLMERSEPSLAAKAARSPLFEDAFQPGASLFADTEDSEKMDQIQAALTDIIAHERFSDTRSVDSRPTLSDFRAFSEGEIPTNAAGFDEEPQSADPSTEEAGGDITRRTMLSGRTLRNAILQIDKSVQDLHSQEAMLSALIRKAELTGDQHKLHLLAKSKRALDREIRELHFQKDQYEQQEVQSRISAGRTTVAIPSATLQEDDGGKSYVRYLVEVQQSGVEGAPGMGWVIARRYNEFLALHQRLREEYSLVRALDFPGKRLVTNMSPLFIESRRLALEKYLQVTIDPIRGTSN
jgi:sorting nexin-25